MIWWVVGCTGDLGVTKYNNGPEATILSHADGDQVAAGATASLRGQVTDADDATADLVASWLADGVEVCAPAAPAEDGTTLCDVPIAASDVAVTLEVRDPSNAIGTAEVVLVVGAAGLGSPVVEILDPADGTSVEAGTPVLFQGVVSDDADAASDLEVVWTSSLDGALDRPVPSISGVVSFTAPALSVGVHDVSLEATDALGLVGMASVRVEVVDCAVSWWADVDGDGYGDVDTTTIACAQPAGFTDNPLDCDDGNPFVNPAAAELCDDGLDNDCDDLEDEGCLGTNCFDDDAIMSDLRYFQVSGALDGADTPDGLDYRSDDWEVQAVGGMDLAFHAWSQDFDGWLKLYDPTCAVYASTGTGGRDTNPFLQVRIPYDGIWTVVVTSTNPGESGGYVLELIDDSYVVGQNCVLDTSTLDVLTSPYADSLAESLQNSDSDFGGSFYYDDVEYYAFYGDDIVIDHLSSAFDPIVNLYDPDCALVTYNEDSGADGTDARITTTTDRTGIYTITPWAEFSRSTGNYTLEIEASW
jgi:hypothetical protein